MRVCSLSLCLALLGLSAHSYADAPLRCEGQLIREGSSVLDLTKYCGEPQSKTPGPQIGHSITDSNTTATLNNHPQLEIQGQTSEHTTQIQTEIWSYDMGYGQMPAQITIAGGNILHIKRLAR